MKLMKFLKSSAGRKFYNFAYCWGACLVILGAVFKIAHMPFDSVLLMVGLFTEVFIFFISGFDTPDEPYRWEKIFPELKTAEKERIMAISWSRPGNSIWKVSRPWKTVSTVLTLSTKNKRHA